MFVDHGEQILSVICGEAFHVPQDCYHASECFLLQSNNHSAIHFPLISVFPDRCSLLQLPLETLQLPNSPSPESSHCTQTVSKLSAVQTSEVWLFHTSYISLMYLRKLFASPWLHDLIDSYAAAVLHDVSLSTLP